jgi:hypothetical protein
MITIFIAFVTGFAIASLRHDATRMLTYWPRKRAAQRALDQIAREP